MNDMWKMKFNHSMYAVLMVGILFSGCATVMIEAGKKAFEDRNTEDQITDTKIATGVLSRLSDRDKSLLLDVNVDVWEQRALLTGTLDNSQEKQAVAELVNSDSRITKIYNDIQIVTKAEKETRREKAEGGNQNSKEEIGQTVDDIWINTKIEAQLIAKKGIYSGPQNSDHRFSKMRPWFERGTRWGKYGSGIVQNLRPRWLLKR